MDKIYDVAIVGLGAMGSAVAYHAAQRNLKVIGFDRFTPPHAMGSTHGQTRVIREAYFENPIYVPLVQRAYTLWAALEAECGHTLHVETGGLMIGTPGSEVVSGAIRSAKQHGLAYERLTPEQLHQRFAMFSLADGLEGVFEPRAGMLYPEVCVEAHLRLAEDMGAQLHFNEAVQSWAADGDGVRITTDRGTVYAEQLVLSAGPWIQALLPELSLPLTVERQVMYRFSPGIPAHTLAPERFPIFIWEYTPGKGFYGTPLVDGVFKVALHYGGALTNADEIRRMVAPWEVSRVRGLMAQLLPRAGGALQSTSVCMYTNTPDAHFLIDRHPLYPQVQMVCPCSGHGFKFASAIGECVADVLTQGSPSFDLTPFGLSRLVEV